MDEARAIVWLVGLVGLVWLMGQWDQCRRLKVGPKVKEKVERALRARTPEDCPACCDESRPAGQRSLEGQVPPWREVKSRRGRCKRLNTEGYACVNEVCKYYGITDASVHALVGCGGHGKRERIQDLKCQACGKKMTERRNTALYRLKTPVKRVAEVLSALVEGLDVSAAVRVFGHGEGTIRTWLTRAGLHSGRVHGHFFHDLILKYIQLDELRTTLRRKSRELWLWVALDVETKVVLVLQVGPRTQAMAHRVVHELCSYLAPGCVPLFSSDGLDHYFYALTAHFGLWCQQLGAQKRHWEVTANLWYGQVKKVYRHRRLVRVEYRMRLGQLSQLTTKLHELDLGRVLNTAFVERVNLTIRQGVPALTRRTWSTAQEQGELSLHLAWWRGYYHFVRPHQSLRVELVQPLERGGQRWPQRYRSRTPAMAVGLTRHRWTVVEFLKLPLPPAVV